MAERPILMSPDMVLATLDNRKTMTRRAVKFPAGFTAESVCKIDFHSIRGPDSWAFNGTGVLNNETLKRFHKGIKCPYGQPGDVLWVRESFRVSSAHDSLPMAQVPAGDSVEYAVDRELILAGKTRPSIFMPRWASRIFLEVTAVRVERLQDISYADALREGFPDGKPGALAEFQGYWDRLAKPGQRWEDNPWAWAITFKRLEDYHG